MVFKNDITDHTSFIDPNIKQLQEVNISALVERFHTGKDPLVLMQVLSEASTLYTRMTPALTSMFQVGWVKIMPNSGVHFMKGKTTKTRLNWHYYCYQFHQFQLFVRGE